MGRKLAPLATIYIPGGFPTPRTFRHLFAAIDHVSGYEFVSCFPAFFEFRYLTGIIERCSYLPPGGHIPRRRGSGLE